MSFPTDLSQREAYILDAVRSGDFEQEWVRITHTERDHSITLEVGADALRVNGVRVNVSAKLCQQIADLTGSMLLTPKIADLIFDKAAFRVGPQPRPITSSTEAMLDHSRKVDLALGKLPGYGERSGPVLVDTVGKYWCISNELRRTTTKALNYGWHFWGASYQGIKGFPCDSGLSYRVIQPSATAHDYAHVDYSQIHRTVSEVCWLDNEQRALRDVLTDPNLSYLVSHEGPLEVLRQPGVSEPTERVLVLPKITVTA